MANPKYPKVPEAKISSIDITSFNGGLDQRGEANIQPNFFASSQNAMVTLDGLVTQRLGLKRWLPDTVGTVYQILPAIYNGITYYVTADNGQIKYTTDGATSWTIAGGTNTITTIGVTNTFLRIQNKLLILNGTDYLGYFDLSTFNVVIFSPITDPTTVPTAVVVGAITGTTQKVYYCIAYNGVIGKTKSTPILTQLLGKIREQWATDGSQGVIVTDTNTRPAGAVSWNLYLATGTVGGTVQFSDLAPLAIGIDLAQTTYFDNGKVIQSDKIGTAPTVNSTQGPKAKYGVELGGRPFLYGITGDPYAVMIGGDGIHALDFTEANGGYRLILNDGTDFFPTSIVGFRNGQATPATTVLYSSVSGLSKASIIDQSTITLGNYSAVVWGSIDQNYGASGVSSPYAVLDYRGRLLFPSVDGFTNIDTSKLRFNVLTATRVSDPVSDEVLSIKNNLLQQIVGTAWANRLMFSIPARGFNYNNEILIYDVTRDGNESWYTFDIRSQWIGTVSPPNSAGFVYVCQDNHIFRLDTAYVAQDETSTGLTVPFPFQVTTGLIGVNPAHDSFFAAVQASFYLKDFLGSATLIVRYRDYQSGLMKTKKKTVSNGVYTKSSAGGWASSGYEFNQNTSTTVLRWGEIDVITYSQNAQKISKAYRVQLNGVITNEFQATVAMNLDNSSVGVRSISFQGQPLGVSPDVRG